MFLHQDFSSQTTVHLNTYILMVRGWRTLDLDRKENCLNINTIILTFMGPCIVNISQYISNKIQLYTVYLYLETALHVSGGTSTHHQERKQLYLQHLLFVRPLLLPADIAADSGR